MATYTVKDNVATLTGRGVRSMTIPRQVLFNLIELNADSLGDEIREALEELHSLAGRDRAALVILVEPEDE